MIGELARRDPFDRIDANDAPRREEEVLLQRIEADYYRSVLGWFFGFLLTDRRPASILEVGCGTGHLLARAMSMLEPPLARLAGVDRSAFLVSNAARRFPTIEFQTADGRQLPFPDHSFDCTYTATVLVHTEEPERVFAEMTRVTKPGGIVAVLDQDFETAVLHPGDKELTRRVLNAATDFWSDGWIGRKLCAYASRAGLRDIRCDAHTRIDRTFDRDFFARIHDWILARGFSAADASRWLATLENADPGEFFFSRTFYAVTGIR